MEVVPWCVSGVLPAPDLTAHAVTTQVECAPCPIQHIDGGLLESMRVMGDPSELAPAPASCRVRGPPLKCAAKEPSQLV